MHGVTLCPVGGSGTSPCSIFENCILGSWQSRAFKCGSSLNAGQARKGTRWMPRREKATKDVASCDKLRGAAKQALIRRSPNGETQPA